MRYTTCLSQLRACHLEKTLVSHFHLKVFAQPFGFHSTGSFLSLFIAYFFECKFNSENIERAFIGRFAKFRNRFVRTGANRLNSTIA